MKKIFVLLVVLFSLISASPVLAEGDDVTFCHKAGTPAEQTMTLPRQAFENGHSGHGDSEGECSSDEGGGVDYHPETNNGGTTTIVVITEDGEQKKVVRGTIPVCFPKKSVIGTMEDGSLMVITPDGKQYPIVVSNAVITYGSFAVDGCRIYASLRLQPEKYEDIYMLQVFDNGGLYVKQLTTTPAFAEKNVEVVDENNVLTTLYAGTLKKTQISLVVRLRLTDNYMSFVGMGEYGTAGFGNIAIQSQGFVKSNDEVLQGTDPEIAGNGDVFVTTLSGVQNSDGQMIQGENIEFDSKGSEVAIQENNVLTFAEIDLSASFVDLTVLSEVELPDGFNLLDFWNR